MIKYKHTTHTPKRHQQADRGNNDGKITVSEIVGFLISFLLTFALWLMACQPTPS